MDKEIRVSVDFGTFGYNKTFSDRDEAVDFIKKKLDDGATEIKVRKPSASSVGTRQERKVFDTSLGVIKFDSSFTVFIDKIAVPNVTNYKVTTSESGETEVELKVKLNSEVTDLEFVFRDPRRKPEICHTDSM